MDKVFGVVIGYQGRGFLSYHRPRTIKDIIEEHAQRAEADAADRAPFVVPEPLTKSQQ